MNVLPKYLYLFQCLPIWLPERFFSQLDSMILNSIWGGKNPRICKSLIQKGRGDSVYPNSQLYYWTANLHKVALWISDTDSDWVHTEASSCHSSSLKALVCSSLSLKPRLHSANPIVINTGSR